MRREFSVLAEGRHIFGRSPNQRSAPEAFRAGHQKDLTETGNRARKVSGTQGSPWVPRLVSVYIFALFCPLRSDFETWA